MTGKGSINPLMKQLGLVISDLPMILSGDYIGLIDPQAAYLLDQSSPFSWDLKDDRNFIESREKQFQPLYHNLFESNSDLLKETSSYKHTIFRFPLRNKASLLSDTCYSQDKVEKLFQRLILDEEDSPLFLKNIQCIKMYQFPENTEEPELMYSMRIGGDSAKVWSRLKHESVSKEVTGKLPIPLEGQHLLHDNEFGIECFGQTEPLTTRLRSILEGYTDGLAILKETIQNADDAGASEVKLIYDMRQNSNCRNSLLDPNMASWQGPAIWIYNDSVFKDEDFDNIIKLNGATKMEKEDKIGAFGLGFNAVYNMTDVPSILSQDTLVMLDPHLKFLGGVIDDKSKPGLRVNMKRGTKLRKKYPDQFAPWRGVCGCNFLPESENVTFNGTLFRLPLRGQKDRFPSDISDQCYDKENVVELFKLIHERGKDMLLFTQNVTKVSVSLIKEQEISDHLEVTDLFEIMKEPVEYLREHAIKINDSSSALKDEERQKFCTESSILKVSAENKGQEDIKSSMIVATILETTDNYSRFIDSSLEYKSQKTHWVVTNCIQYSPSVASEPRTQKPGIAGVAVCLEKQTDFYLMKGLDSPENNPRGSYFSFLPLPVKCPLPFHINGTFVLDPSRRHLLQKTEHDKTSIGGTWNETLFKGAVCTAYVTMLEDILPLTAPDTDLTRLLPYNKEDDMISWLSEAFWKKMVEHYTTIPIFSSSSGMVSFQDAYFLDESFMAMTEEIQAAVIHVINTEFIDTKRTLVNLPNHLKATLKGIAGSQFRLKTITQEKFFLDFFLPNQTQLPLTQKESETLLLTALHLNSAAVKDVLQSQPSIPVSEDGQQLVHPKHLIHPYGRAAKLYKEQDHRFPHFSTTSLMDSCLEMLCELGMVQDDLPWEDILARSTGLAEACPRNTIDDVNELLNYLKWKLQNMCQDVPYNVQERMRNEKFLPTAERPKDWKIKWKGENHKSFGASEIYELKDPLLACTQFPILHEKICISRDVTEFLGMKAEDYGFNIPLENLRDQMLQVTSDKENLKCSSIKHSFNEVQSYLDLECRDDIKAEKVRRTFSDIPIILMRDCLLEAKTCAFNPTFEAFPYLNKIPRQNQRFMEAAGVREVFLYNDYISAVSRVKNTFVDEPLQQVVLFQVVEMLEGAIGSKGNKTTLDQTCSQMVFIPDRKGVLKPANSLCYLDCSEFQKKEQFSLVHQSITNDVAKSLGVKGLKQQVLSEKRSIIDYTGEDLLNDIHSALEPRPSGDQVLMELIKDADAQGAKEIHFILDPRNHRDKSIFNDGWKHLQGPALCVHHDGNATDSGLKEMLGLGTGKQTKKKHRTLYHFTETPTLLTTFDNGIKALCVVDPTGCIVPGTSAQEPAVMFKDVETLKLLFPDVFSCYDENHCKDGNMFRFPLRKPSAEDGSQSSRPAIDCEEVDKILQNISRDGFEALIFLTSLRKIHITRINAQNEKSKTETITAELFDASQTEMDGFKEFLYQQGQMQETLTSNPVQREISYSLAMSAIGKKQKWSVVQQCGMAASTKDISVSGVAYLIEKDGIEKTSKQGDCGSIYCSPYKLTHETKLPVHIYGSFSVNLDKKGYESVDMDKKQNIQVAHGVVSAYLTLILKEKQRATMRDEKISATQRENYYYRVFPSYQKKKTTPNESSEKNIENWIIHKLYASLSGEKVIIVHSKDCMLKWVQPRDTCFMVRSLNAKEGNVIKGAELCGFRYATCPKTICSMFEEFGPCELEYFSPLVLIKFLKQPKTCNWKALAEKLERDAEYEPGVDPMPSNPTGMDIVESMIEFCLLEKTFKSNLHQVPLLVTADGKLNLFDINRPVYKSPDTWAVSPTSDRFLHRQFQTLFEKVESPVFQPINTKAFCEELKRELPHICMNEPIHWGTQLGITRLRLEEVWNFLDRIKERDDGIKELLQLGYGGELCIVPTLIQKTGYLFPLNKIHHVFENESKHNMYSQIYSKIKDHRLPISNLRGEHSLFNDMLATWDKPKHVLKALHYYYEKDNTLSDMFKDDKFLKYLKSHQQTLNHIDIDMVKGLPLYETLTGAYIAIAKQWPHVIPSSVPVDDIDYWKESNVFLKAKKEFRGLYDILGCDQWGEAKLYVECIFPYLENISEEGRNVHMEYVFDNLQESEQVMEALSKIRCTRNRKGFNCRPCELYDPTVSVFLNMHDDTKLAEDSEERLKVLRKAGMKYEVTKQMLLDYAKQIARSESKDIEHKSCSLLEYVKKLNDSTLQAEYLRTVAEIPFIPRKCSRNKEICPDYTHKHFVTLKNSVIETQEDLVWTVAPLVATKLIDFDKEVLEAAGVIYEPSCGMAVKNIRRVCENCKSEPIKFDRKWDRSLRIAACFQYISKNIENNELSNEEIVELKDILADEHCVPVQRGDRFIKPCQAVVEAESEEEMKPYIYQLPDNLTNSKPVLMLLGLSEVPTVRTYQMALGLIYAKVGQKPITDKVDLEAAARATRQVFQKMKHQKTLNTEEDLWLLTTENHLCKADEAIFNNKKALKGRLQSSRNILVHIPEIGSIEDILEWFPPTHRPQLLTSVVKEVVAPAKGNGNEEQNKLQIHFSSEATVTSIERVGYHVLKSKPDYDQKSIQKMLHQICEAVRNIKIRIDEKVETYVMDTESTLEGSEKERLVFADYNHSVVYIAKHALEPGPNQFHAYKVLADMINYVNEGLFEGQIGVLMVILSEETENLANRLDEMEILPLEHFEW